MNLEPALNTFKIEAEELVAAMEKQFLCLEENPSDEEAIGAVFRAAHTIKGSAGLFGFDETVRFTHEMESVLMAARDHTLELDLDILSVLLKCCDQIGDLVARVSADGEALDDNLLLVNQKLLSELFDVTGSPAHEAPPEVSADADIDTEVSADQQTQGGSKYWHLSLRFNRDILEQGMDPLSFIRYLRNLGEIISLTTIGDELPSWSEYDPESLYLGFEIALDTTATKAQIEEVFEFVLEDSDIKIIAPHANAETFISLIKSLPEAELMLGEILIACQAITQRELDLALYDQSTEKNEKLGQILTDQQRVDAKVLDQALNKQKSDRGAKNKGKQLLRVDAGRLDSLISLIGELVITSSKADLLANQTGQEELIETLETMSKFVEDIRGGCLQLRMVSIGDTFAKFQRVVRDISREQGKKIALDVYGEDCELDKSMVEQLNDPLLHLVRNAIDHGIEPAEQRLALGKPEQGTVTLGAYHEAGNIVIEINDDGRGLNKQKIIDKAISKGLINSEQGLSEQEIFQLIFQAGFSTVDEVTDISGRGVGMDVVKRSLDALHGTIEIESEQNQGTRMRIRLPLTLAIIDGFMLGVESSCYVIPQDAVVECVEFGADDQRLNGDNDYINIRGEMLPLLRLRNMFGFTKRHQSRENVVVVQSAGQLAGIVVDEVLGDLQTVVKPMSKIFNHLSWLNGSTILGSGDVAVILDVAGLVQIAKQRFVQHQQLKAV